MLWKRNSLMLMRRPLCWASQCELFGGFGIRYACRRPSMSAGVSAGGSLTFRLGWKAVAWIAGGPAGRPRLASRRAPMRTRPAEMGAGGDVSDWLARGGTKEQLLDAVAKLCLHNQCC